MKFNWRQKGDKATSDAKPQEQEQGQGEAVKSESSAPQQAAVKSDIERQLEPELEAKPKQDLEAHCEEPTMEPAHGEGQSLSQRLGQTVSAPWRGVSSRVQRRIRAKAIERARTRILIAGQSPENLPVETLEIVVREEEDKIKNQIKEKGLLFVIASLGFGWWV